MALMFDEKLLIKEIAKQKNDLFTLNETKLLNLVGEFLYNLNDGNFEIISNNKTSSENTDADTEVVSLDKGLFKKALLNKTDLEKETTELEKIYVNGKDKPEFKGLLDEILRNRKALSLVESNTDQIKTIKNSCLYLFGIKNQEGLPVVHDFIKESAVLDKLDFYLSERIQNRFYSRFKQITKGQKSDIYKTAFLNTVGEYVLVSMGIISPELFSLKKGYFGDDQYNDLKTKLTEDGIDIERLFSYYSLKGPGTIFVNRWNTVEAEPGRITDEKIREFITETVRKNEDAVLEIFNYENFFEEAKDISIAAKNIEERKDMEIKLKELLQKRFEKKEAKDKLIELIKNKWYPKLNIFYKNTE